MSADLAWDDFRRQLDAALAAFVTGDVEPYTAVWSRADDVSIFGGWSAYEKGWREVGPRLEWAASRYGGGVVEVETIAEHVGNDLACIVAIEHDDARLDGATVSSQFGLRVTHVCRREADGWRVVHRHADFLQPRQEAPNP